MPSCRQAAIGRGIESGLRHRGDTSFPASNLLGRKVQQRITDGCLLFARDRMPSCGQAAIGRGRGRGGMKAASDTEATPAFRLSARSHYPSPPLPYRLDQLQKKNVKTPKEC
jgi:hypothetical protein